MWCLFFFNKKIIFNPDIFPKVFFAYFEDTYLSYFLNQNKIKILYNPDIEISHQLSGSSNLDLRRKMITRSSAIFNFLKNQTKEEFLKCNHIIMNNNFKYDKEIQLLPFQAFNNHEFKSRNTFFPSVIIINKYWLTNGGGENAAINFAKLISNKKYIGNLMIAVASKEELLVLLKNFDNFNKIKFLNFFEDFNNLSAITNKFDYAIDFTFNSNIKLQSTYNYRYIHFPLSKNEFKNINPIFNSEFSMSHSSIKGKIIEPVFVKSVFKDKLEFDDISSMKTDTIVVLGRFFKIGHNKKQLEILKAFKKVSKLIPHLKLKFIGRFDKDNTSQSEYVDDLVKNMDNKNIEIHLNISDDMRDKILLNSKYLVSATGLNELDSSKMEHFGIGVIEALNFGLYPIVFHKGGPADIVNKISYGKTFDSEETLTSIFSQLENIKVSYVDYLSFVSNYSLKNTDRMLDSLFINAKKLLN